MVKRSTVAKRAAPAKPKAAASVRPRVTEPEIPAAQSKAPSEPAAADVIEANQEGQGDGKAQQEGSGADHGATPKPQPPVEETGGAAAGQGDGEAGENAKNPSELARLAASGTVVIESDGAGLEAAETEDVEASFVDQAVDLIDLDVNAVAANTAQAAASELVLQLMPWPMEPGEDGEDDVPVDSWDPELWINGCCAGPSVDGDLSPHEILAAYSASRPGVVPGDALYRQAHKLGLHDGKVDAFYELPEALQLAYGIFAKTAWSTARALRRLAAVAAENALPAAGVPEPGRGFSTKDEDDPIHQPGERGWR